MRNYGIAGFARHGKDTVGSFITELDGKTTYALAEPIKAVIKTMFNWTEEHVNGSLKEVVCDAKMDVASIDACGIVFAEYGLDKYQDFDYFLQSFWLILGEFRWADLHWKISPRKALQLLGTEWGRSVNKNIWKLLAPDNAVITDIRFDDEAEFFKNKGYEIILVNDPRKGNVVSDHASEAGISHYYVDTYIVNDGSLEDLRNQVKKLLAKDDNFLL